MKWIKRIGIIVSLSTDLSWAKVFSIIPEFRILRPTFMESRPQNAETGKL